jgi:hypothetical protein
MTKRTPDPVPIPEPDPLRLLQEVQLQVVGTQLDSERQRKQSLEQRGITIITSAGAIATLIFAVSAFVSKSTNTAKFVRAEALPIKLSIVAFLIAAVLGLGTNLPFRYGGLSARSLLEVYKQQRSEGADYIGFQESLIYANSEILRRTQRLNFYKSEILLTGFLFEIIGIGFLVWAVFEITSHVL